MTVNEATIALIKKFEGFSARAYADPVGVITIGFGTTEAAQVGIRPKLGMTISEAEAEKYLHAAIDKFADTIRPKIKGPVNDNEFGAFVSLAYNIGPGAFARSTALRKFNLGDKLGAADAILFFNKAGGRTLNGLVRRRMAERALFMSDPIPSRPNHEPRPDLRPVKPGFWATFFAAVVAFFTGSKS